MSNVSMSASVPVSTVVKLLQENKHVASNDVKLVTVNHGTGSEPLQLLCTNVVGPESDGTLVESLLQAFWHRRGVCCIQLDSTPDTAGSHKAIFSSLVGNACSQLLQQLHQTSHSPELEVFVTSPPQCSGRSHRQPSFTFDTGDSSAAVSSATTLSNEQSSQRHKVFRFSGIMQAKC